MKILHCVETYNPLVNGMQTVVQQISERLVEMGHDVTVVTSKNTKRAIYELNGVKIIEFNISGGFVSGLTGEVNSYEQFLLNSKYDIVATFAAQQWTTDILLPLSHLIPGKKVFVPTGFSGLYEPSFACYFEQMKDWMRNFDMNIFLSYSYRDFNFAKQNNIKKIKVIPNGANEKEFEQPSQIDIKKKYNIPDTHKLILHVGGHTSHKGHSEAIEIFKRANISSATFLLIAHPVPSNGCEHNCNKLAIEYNQSEDAKLKDKKIIIDFPSRKETVAAYKESDLFLFPSNIECSPLVIFESMAAGVPFLATDVGNVSEIIEWSNGGIIMPTLKSNDETSSAIIPESVKLFEELLNDKKKLILLGKNGLSSWKEKFQWEKIAKEYETTYLDLLNKEEPTFKTNKKLTVIFEPKSSGDIEILLKYESLSYVNNIIVINNYKLDLDTLKNSSKISQINTNEDKNQLLKSLKDDFFIIIDSDNPINTARLFNMMELLSKDNVGLVYQNYSALRANREEKYRFSIMELDYWDRGNIYKSLLEKNKINSTLANIMINRSAVELVGGFNCELKSKQDWDLILRISEKYQIDYVHNYDHLLTTSNYYLNSLEQTVFEDEIRFINLWTSNLSHKVLKIWANYISWKVNMVFPKKYLLKVAKKELTPRSKKLLFKQAFGSIDLYLLLTVYVILLKTVLRSFLSSFAEILTSFKKLFFIVLT